MLINVEFSSPFYKAYEAQAEVINAAITKAAEESAAKMGEHFKDVYAMTKPLESQQAA